MKHLKQLIVVALTGWIIALSPAALAGEWYFTEGGGMNGADNASISNIDGIYISVECNAYGNLTVYLHPYDRYTAGSGEIEFLFDSRTLHHKRIIAAASYLRKWGDFAIHGAQAKEVVSALKRYDKVRYFYPLDARLVTFSLKGSAKTLNELDC